MFGVGEHIEDSFAEAEMLNHKMSLREDAEIKTLKWIDGEAPIIECKSHPMTLGIAALRL